jgi:Subtilase family
MYKYTMSFSSTSTHELRSRFRQQRFILLLILILTLTISNILANEIIDPTTNLHPKEQSSSSSSRTERQRDRRSLQKRRRKHHYGKKQNNQQQQQPNEFLSSEIIEKLVHDIHSLYDGNYKYTTFDTVHHMLLFQLDDYYNNNTRKQQTRNHDKKDYHSDDMNHTRHLAQNIHQRVLIRYNQKSDTIYSVIEQVSNAIFYHFETVHLVAADISYSTYVLLQRNENITHIEYDATYKEQSIMVHEFQTETNHNQTDHLLDHNDWESSSLLDKLMTTTSDDVENHSNNNKDTRRNRRRLLEQVTYGVKMIQADQLSYNMNTKTSIPVCIIDTGVSTSHPDLQGNTYHGADRIASTSNQWLYWNSDKRGHGTHVTGIISARANNNIGLRGIDGYNAIPIYITRGLDDNGNARESDIYNAMRQCYQSGAKIISMSLCSPSPMSSTTKSYIETLYHQSNIILVAAAGNEKGYTNQYPAAYNTVVSVSSVDANEQFSSDFSNYSPTVELAAPGSNILSTSVSYNSNTNTITNTYAIFSGTSMSTPYVSGIMSILWSYHPSCTPTQIRYAIAMTAKDKGSTGCDDYYGYGIPQLYNAYQYLKKNSCVLSRRGFKRWGYDIGDGTCSLT